MNVGEFDFQRMGGAAEGEGERECCGEQGTFEVHHCVSSFIVFLFKAQRCS
ncbi:hypothetical protein D3C87_2022920 [compost metagenome]